MTAVTAVGANVLMTCIAGLQKRVTRDVDTGGGGGGVGRGLDLFELRYVFRKRVNL